MDTIREYKPVLTIPLCYVREVCDTGITKTVTTNTATGGEEVVDNDDLCMCVRLSGGIELLLINKQRIYIDEGYLVIEDLYPS